MTTEYMERIGHEATFKYGKIEYEMENSMNRYDRLEGDDGFDDAPVWSRPRTKAKEGGSLYVENIEIVIYNIQIIFNMIGANKFNKNG